MNPDPMVLFIAVMTLLTGLYFVRVILPMFLRRRRRDRVSRTVPAAIAKRGRRKRHAAARARVRFK